MSTLLKTLLAKVPFLGTAVSWATGNLRTIIEYALVCVTMAIGGAAITLWFKTKVLEDKAETLQGNLIVEQVINQQQNEALRAYQDLRRRDAEAMDTVVHSMDILVSKSASHKEKLATLERNNEIIRETLHAPVPSGISCLYNPSTCPEASGASGAGTPASNAVPALPGASRSPMGNGG